ncbi:MAG: ATP-grasp enzyme, partial [Nakamurella sp.]
MATSSADVGSTPAQSIKAGAKTIGMLGLLTMVLPLNLALTGAALIRSAFVNAPTRTASTPRTVLVSGGKMTKSLQLARSFHAAGHRVIMVESAKYRYTGHRFSRAVDRFYTVPKPQSPQYEQALVDIVRAEGVDVYVPVCSPAASFYDALAKPALSQYCEVLHCDPDMISTLDDKYEFTTLAASLGLPVPDAHRISSADQVEDFDFDTADRPYILKSIPYDPVNRLDLTTLPQPTPLLTAAFARSKPISRDHPWIMQA